MPVNGLHVSLIEFVGHVTTHIFHRGTARPEEIKDLHTLVDMYFKKRDITLQARKAYDSFLATPRKKYINWVTFIALLLFIAGVVVAMMFFS